MLGRHEDAETLTGRIPIWTELLSHIRAQAASGLRLRGVLDGQDTLTPSRADVQWPVRQAHNTYIDGVLSARPDRRGGVSGRRAAEHRAARAGGLPRDGRPWICLHFCMIVFGMVSACLETGMMGPSFPTLMAGSGIVTTSGFTMEYPSHSSPSR